MQKDNISEIYRKSIDEFLEPQANLHFSAPLSQNEQDSMWDEILTDLDLGDIWNSISNDLDLMMPPNPGYGIILRSIAALLITTLCLIPVNKTELYSYNKSEENIAKTPQSDTRPESILEIQQAETAAGDLRNIESSFFSKSASEISKEIASAHLPEINKTKLEKGAPIDAENVSFPEKIVTADVGEYERPIDPDVFQSAFVPQLKISSDIPFDHLNMILCTSTSGLQESITVRTRLSLGLIAQYKNTWLLNNETFDGFNSESLNTTVIVFAPDIGISVNYLFANNWSIQSDGFVYSNTSQEYIQYIYGNYSKKNITLRYSTIVLSAKYRIVLKNGSSNRSSINLFAGSYMSFLHDARQYIINRYSDPENLNSDFENIRTQYRKFDYGVKLGGEIELCLAPHFSLASGLFLSVGIPNIYMGNGYVPGNFRRTRIGCGGVQIVLFYTL